MSERLTLQDLVDLLSDKQGITKKDAENFIREFVDLTSETIYGNDFVRIKDLGTFKLTPVKPRRSVDVNTGEAIEIAAHYKLSFTPDKVLREAVNRPFAHFESILIDEEVSFEDKVPEDSKKKDVEKAKKAEQPEVKEPEKEAVVVSPTPMQEEVVVPVEAVEVEEKIEVVDLVEDEIVETEIETVEVVDIQPEPVAEPIAVAEPVVQKPILEQPAVTEVVAEEPVESVPEPLVVEKPTPVAPVQEPISARSDDEDDDYWENQYLEEKKKRNKRIGIGVLVVLLLVLGYFGYSRLSVDAPEEVAVAQNNANVTITDDAGNVTPAITDDSSVEGVNPDQEIEGGSDVTANNNLKAEETVQSTAPTQVEKGKEIEVQEKETMRGLGVKYYGHRAFWVYIFEENKEIISRPDAIYAGMKLILPPASKYGIDANDKTSVRKAERQEMKLFGEFAN